MSFLNIGSQLAGAQDEHAVEEGEYQIRITAADIPEGAQYAIIRFEIMDDPYAKELSKFLNLPGAGRTPKEENRNLLQWQYFFKAFGIDPEGNYDIGQQAPEGFVGLEGWALIGPPTDDGKGYGAQNKIKRFIAGN